MANTFDTITGFVEGVLDPEDQFNFSGLTPGSFFDVFVQRLGDDLSAIAQDSGGGSLGPDASLALPPGSTGHLTGVVPGNGQLSVILSTSPTFSDNEDYQITLSTRAQVPVPATIALLAAGLIGVGGAHVARRKRPA